MATQAESLTKTLIAILVVAVIAILGYNFLTMKDNRSTTDRIGDAVHALPQGLDKASEQLEDRTPGQKLGDSVEDAGGTIKKDTSGD